ncbi:MAG: T9SS type A sorting domain-containing protein, partial [Crocinitomicaceae bacterium]|nr:T9SS type A sorting domain-containing protein [Crocinitomicaceae bacterium]
IITAATSTDNCIGDSIVYTLSGATTASNVFDLSTVTFNAGTTTVTTVALDAAGNSDSCSFEVVMNALPTVSLASFSVDTLCVSYAPIALPTGTPASGTYTGTGISGTDFDPLITGVGTYYITYTYTDSLGCVNSDSSAIVVDGCAGIDENNALTSVKVYPNPTTNVITIDLGNHKGSVDYSLVSLEGKVIEKVYNVSTSEIVLDLSQELAGVYLLRIDDNTSFKITKVVKQ